MNAKKLQEFADHLAEEPDQDYKDEWERGYDAGLMFAGRELRKLLAAGGPTEADVDREALRIVNLGRILNPVKMLDSLNPASQAHYRVMARQILRGDL